MHRLDLPLFLYLNAGARPAAMQLDIAYFLAVKLIWGVPLLLLGLWFLSTTIAARQQTIAASCVAALGLLFAQVCRWVWYSPRPFVDEIGWSYLAHAADSSFPSYHLTFLWSVAFTLIAQAQTRRLGIACGLLGLPIAWARIYLGVHYPFDMLGAVMVALAASSLWLSQCTQYSDWMARLLEPLHHRFKLAGRRPKR